MMPLEMEICFCVRYVAVLDLLYRSIICNAAISRGKTYQNSDKSQEINLRIAQQLPNLRDLKMPIRHPGPILRNMIQQRQLLMPFQPPRSHRAIGNNPPRQRAKQARHSPQNNKHRPPPTQTRPGAHILKPKRHQAANDLRNAEPAIPDAEARRLLRARVPLRPDQH